MNRGLKVTPRADADIDEIFLHIALDSPTAAVRFLDQIEATFQRLREFPGIGRVRGFGLDVEVRSWAVSGFENHLLFCSDDGHDVCVLRVLHGARDLPAVFEDEQDE